MRILGLSTLCLLAACTVPSGKTRIEQASALASVQGWRLQEIPAGDFTLAAYVPAAPARADTLTIYLEGDGLAWLSRSRASADPTPGEPVALKLALRHPGGAAAYLARPCQYLAVDARGGCDQAYWTERRFAAEAVAASSRAVDALKRQFGARRLVLVGYSGGGAMAALVAATRQDVAQLVSVAGNLDHQAWTELHGVRPLQGSLNPADAWRQLAEIPQLHWIGGKDKIVTLAVAQAYQARFPADQRPQVRVVEEFDHVCCWAERWPGELLPPLPR